MGARILGPGAKSATSRALFPILTIVTAPTLGLETLIPEPTMRQDKSLLQRFLRSRVGPAPVAIDAADMGTCIGLDMILDQPPQAAAGVAEAPRRWWQRQARPAPAAG
jgi:hypothetical protein